MRRGNAKRFGRDSLEFELKGRERLALLNDPEISVRDAAKRPGFSVSTLYRHAPRLRSRVVETARSDDAELYPIGWPRIWAASGERQSTGGMAKLVASRPGRC